ncbi:phosphatase PAP2 family protein [Wenyingzhuangia sp. IMCC45574]
MRKQLFFFVFFISITINAQYNTNKKTSFRDRLTTAGSVLKTSFKTIPSDFKYMGKNVTEDWKQTALYTGIVGALIAFDKPLTTLYQDHVEDNIQYKLPAITVNNADFPWLAGEDAYMFYTMTGVYVASLFNGSEKGQYAAVNGYKALIYSIAISHTFLKTVFGRKRPYHHLREGLTEDPLTTTDNPYDFFNSRQGEYIFSSPHGTALPSLHATAFFAMAKVFQMEYDNYWVPYGFMAVVFCSNIRGHQHWLSDMVLGGIVGTVIGRSIVRSSWKERGILPKSKKKFNVSFIPNISTRFNGLTLSATF